MPDNYTVTKLETEAFEELVHSLAPLNVPLEQSPEWGTFENNLGDRIYLGSFRYDQGGRLVALASATLHRERGRDWVWVKHGPVFPTAPNTEDIKKMCATLVDQFTEVNGYRPAFIRLSSPTFRPPLRRPFEHTMYDQTVVLDLAQTEDELWFGMSQTARQEVKKAGKAGLQVRALTRDEAVQLFTTDFYPLLKETARRGGFSVHPDSVYVAMLRHLPAATLWGAFQGSAVTAWAIITSYQGGSLYYYGASGEQARNTGAAYMLQWEIIKQLKASGVMRYDLMGIAGKHYPSLKSVTGFKMKFSKNVIDVPETYDLPLRPLKYHLVAAALKVKRRISR